MNAYHPPGIHVQVDSYGQFVPLQRDAELSPETNRKWIAKYGFEVEPGQHRNRPSSNPSATPGWPEHVTESWRVLMTADRPHEAYEAARLSMANALVFYPNDPDLTLVFGVAQYRCKLFETAISTLSKLGDAPPLALAVQAMAKFRLKQPQAARETLDRARLLARTAALEKDGHTATLLAEASDLIDAAGDSTSETVKSPEGEPHTHTNDTP